METEGERPNRALRFGTYVRRSDIDGSIRLWRMLPVLGQPERGSGIPYADLGKGDQYVETEEC